MSIDSSDSVVERGTVSKGEESSSQSSLSSSSSVNFLPFSIDYDGPAPTSKYFHIFEQSHGHYTSTFRGRELRGSKVSLPNNVSALTITKNSDNPRKLDIFDHFNEITIWEHDFEPNEMNLIGNSLDWFDIAKSIHSDEV